MTSKIIERRDLAIGATVEINPQNDRTRKILIEGDIKEILTTADSHPHGILVLLESGEKGRVKSIKNVSHENTAITSDSKTPSTQDLIRNGENGEVEFKKDVLWSSNYSSEDIKNHRPQSAELHKYGKATSKYIIAKTLAGFLNTEGGILVIGAFEHKDGNVEITGIEAEYEKIKDKTSDGYRRMLVDLVQEYFSTEIFNRFSHYFQLAFEECDSKILCKITVNRSDVRAFLQIKNEELFYIRVDASTRAISGSQLIEYCNKRFS